MNTDTSISLNFFSFRQRRNLALGKSFQIDVGWSYLFK